MRSIIFANHLARETRSFSHTVSVDRGQVRFLGTLTLNIWVLKIFVHFIIPFCSLLIGLWRSN